MKNFLDSKGIHAVLWILGVLVILMLVFGAGVAVGYRSGLFSSRFGENYYHNFFGDESGGMMGGGIIGGPAPMPINQHGTIGTVISVESSTIASKDPSGNEQSVVIDGNTVIRSMDKTISVAAIQDGDHIAVIGEPNDTGQILARFIRVFDASSSPQELPGNQ
jgi:hypothetical protein